MKFSINKVLTAFSNTKAEGAHIDNYTEDIINSIDEAAFAVSQQNVMYAATQELGGYYYLKTIIVGTFKIKTMKGALLKFEAKDFNLDLKTDMDEFETDHSNISNRFITRIDFQIEKEDIPKLKDQNIQNIKLIAKKTKLDFGLIKS